MLRGTIWLMVGAVICGSAIWAMGDYFPAAMQHFSWQSKDVLPWKVLFIIGGIALAIGAVELKEYVGRIWKRS
jgi:hypothetical protein